MTQRYVFLRFFNCFLVQYKLDPQGSSYLWEAINLAYVLEKASKRSSLVQLRISPNNFLRDNLLSIMFSFSLAIQGVGYSFQSFLSSVMFVLSSLCYILDFQTFSRLRAYNTGRWLHISHTSNIDIFVYIVVSSNMIFSGICSSPLPLRYFFFSLSLSLCVFLRMLSLSLNPRGS